MYDEALAKLQLTKMYDRRESICKQYFNKLSSEDNKLHHLLPDHKDTVYDLRSQVPYEPPRVRVNRTQGSFITYALYNLQDSNVMNVHQAP